MQMTMRVEGEVDLEQARDLLHALKEIISRYGMGGWIELKEDF